MIDSRDPSNTYRRKVKTRDELRQIIGSRPRARKVIMCHGTFDLVHPGHLRHLMYAKSKGDILIASLTSDAHISKANYRPFVPQQLRAMNLAALEIVDYVIIDEQPTPLENIAHLQPDYFAKGYEYTGDGIHPKTQQEIDVLNAYGGEIIFTPGDIVFSSSHIIESAPPQIGVEKLLALMEAEAVTFAALRNVLDECRGLRVHVLGDTIVDSYRYCTPIGSSAGKTPTLSVQLEEQVDFAGGAAVVARHLRAAGAEVTFSTVLGDDARRDFVLAEMEQHGVRCLPVVDPTRPTTEKTAYIADGYRLLKVDRVDNRPISEKIAHQFIDALASADVDAYVFSDFRHGIFSKATIPAMTAPSWATFATGKHPGHHGIFDFMLPTNSLGNMKFATSRDLRDTTIYEFLADAGITPILVNLPVTWPPKRNDIITITSLLTQCDEWINPV